MTKLMLLALAAPLALAACGGSSGAHVKDPLATVKRAAQKTADISSEHMTMTMTVSTTGQKVSIEGSGDYLNTPRRGTLSTSLSTQGQRAFTIKAVVDGTKIYMRSLLFSQQIPVDKTWAKVDVVKTETARGLSYSSLLSLTPAQLLQQFEAAGSAKRIATETIDGVETTRYQVTNLDTSKIPQGAEIPTLAPLKYGPIDVWIGNKDGYVYRESLSITYSVESNTTSTTMRFDLSKFGETVNVTVPPASAVFDLTGLSEGSGG